MGCSHSGKIAETVAAFRQLHSSFVNPSYIILPGHIQRLRVERLRPSLKKIGSDMNGKDQERTQKNGRK